MTDARAVDTSASTKLIVLAKDKGINTKSSCLYQSKTEKLAMDWKELIGIFLIRVFLILSGTMCPHWPVKSSAKLTVKSLRR